MATVSSHVLDSVRGGSAVGVGVTLTRIDADGSRSPVFSCQTDGEGRISQAVDVTDQPETRYELAFQTAAYFRTRVSQTKDQTQVQADDNDVVESVIIQLRMKDPDKRYHLPIMASPHSYSLWWSR